MLRPAHDGWPGEAYRVVGATRATSRPGDVTYTLHGDDVIRIEVRKDLRRRA